MKALIKRLGSPYKYIRETEMGSYNLSSPNHLSCKLQLVEAGLSSPRAPLILRDKLLEAGLSSPRAPLILRDKLLEAGLSSPRAPLILRDKS